IRKNDDVLQLSDRRLGNKKRGAGAAIGGRASGVGFPNLSGRHRLRFIVSSRVVGSDLYGTSAEGLGLSNCTLDTGRLNEEAYDCMDAIRQRYGVAVEVYFPDALKVQEMVRRDPPRHRLAPADRRSPRRHARELETRGRRHHGP